MARRAKFEPHEAPQTATSPWGTIGGAAFVAAMGLLLLVVALVTTLSVLLSKDQIINSASGMVRQSAVLELKLQGIDPNQVFDDLAFEGACTDFFTTELQGDLQNVKCSITESGRSLQAVYIRDYKVIMAAVAGDSPLAMRDYYDLLRDIIAEGEPGFIARVVRAAQMFQTLKAINVVDQDQKRNDTTKAPATMGEEVPTDRPEYGLTPTYAPNTQSEYETGAPSMSPSSAPSSSDSPTTSYAPTTASDVWQLIAQVVGVERLQKSGPYQEAIDWIRSNDPQQLDASVPNLLQRYLLAYFYYATGPWSTCGPTDNAAEVLCTLRGSLTSGNMVTDVDQEKTRWLSSESECNWYGVECNTNNRLVKIKLDDIEGELDLHGVFPDGLHYFEDLQEMILKNNRISGPLPAESLAQAKSLVHLHLEGGDIRGAFADVWDAVKSIDRVNLDSNFIVGPLEIPDTGNAIIQYLSMNNNTIGGRLSQTLNRATSLKELLLNFTSLEGPIPSQVYQMSNLEHISLRGNAIDGAIANQIYYMPKLQSLDLSANNLTGLLPVFPVSIQILRLSKNSLSGSIPALPKGLVTLDLASNEITGTLPDSLYQLNSLASLDLTENQLTGTLSTLVGQLSSLADLRLTRNLLSADLPSEIGLLTNLITGDVSQNNFSGVLNLCSPSLQFLGADCRAELTTAQVECPCCDFCCNPDGDSCQGKTIDGNCIPEDDGTGC